MPTQRPGQSRGAVLAAAAAFAALLAVAPAQAQTCTTQARMAPAQRQSIADKALALGQAVAAGDAARVRADTIAAYAADFSATEFLVHATAAHLAGEAVAVTSVYALDAAGVTTGNGGTVDFSCALKDLPAEVDFSIPGLPPGTYAFATVPATGGPQPWLLSFLLSQTAGKWQMAGFYPHPLTAVGHDGPWYWRTARTSAAAKQLWNAWLQYGEADNLLRIANFATSTNLDALRTEQRTAAPPELSAGISAQTPLVIAGAGASGAAETRGPAGSGEFHFTQLGTEPSDDGARLDVSLHLRADSVADARAARTHNVAAASAFAVAHPEVRKAFGGFFVHADSPSGDTFATELPMSEVP